ncbi:helix-turn-helix transcriptional regulator [Brevibacterium album]|uniref:helix-turn-helix transcriptional regulator n=1 Tax=Brevibacterium album TaxID=417948 RepID=UPI0004189D46|nr:YafY family protein [Brevibacterium album]
MSTEDTAARVLRLLSLLQRRHSWFAEELAAELGVTARSVRRDVARLRSLGYPVVSAAGAGGGYRLGRGARMPPLLLDDEEAVAAALSLRLSSTHAVAGAGEAALRALAKLDQVMPPRLRAEVRAVHAATDSLPRPVADVGPDVLLTLARACRDGERVRFSYVSGTGAESARTVEPVHMVTTGPRWYLMAWDLDREDWRTFRLDRVRGLEPTGQRFRRREHPDPVEYVRSSVAEAPYSRTVRVRVRTSAEELAARVPPQVGRVEPDAEEGWSLLTVAGDRLEWIACHLAMLGWEVAVLEPEELREAARDMAARLTALAGGRANHDSAGAQDDAEA